MKNNYLLMLLLTLVLGGAKAQNTKRDAFVKNLMAKMTIEEKIGQLNLLTGGEATTGTAVSTDVESKIVAGKIGGLFSISTPQKIRKVQELAMKSRLKIPVIIGMDVIHGYRTTFPIPLGISATWDLSLVEKSARIAAQEATADGICWTFSPMVDIARDPRWGRIAEGSGEDAFLGSKIAAAMVKGYQGKDLKANNTMMSCVKHFALYGAAEGGRDYNTTDMSRIRMYNEYLPPYKAAIDAGAGSIMASFNEIDGIPATANKWLLTDLLRKQWGFKGFVVTDYTGNNEMIDHGLGDLQTVTYKALTAGTDMDMVGEGFLTTLKKSLDEKKVSLAEIDRACRLILEAKYDLGLFEDPFRYCDENRAKNEIFTVENRAFAREIAAKSFVLLKNKNNVLPLISPKSIALIGPLVNNKENMGGTWAVSENRGNSLTLYDGLKNALGESTQIKMARGTNIYSDPVLDANASPFGKSTGRENRSDEVMLKEAVEAAKASEIIVLALGESAEMSGESSSRSKIGLPENQQKLLSELSKLGKPLVLVIFTGRPLVLETESQQADAILNVWFAGSEAGNAMADVLIGKVNPSGKITASFPRNEGQIPVYYNHKNTGRPHSGKPGFEKFRSNYIDVPNSPLYPFGYGLSYTTFEYGDLKLDKSSITENQKIKVSVDVKNTGNYDGEEVVQLYIRDLVGSVARPVKELKGFQKVLIRKGETKTVKFEIGVEELKFYNSDLKWVAEKGDFQVMVGTNSDDVKKANFILK
ncbi:MAG: beta-glucosidase BglX [Cytophagaceae bacterium]|nr:beta-glucosidase BglX [Cytophagaceae bacterium]MBL0324741.1 beta-glucosidase BglX [Cytophagaceae bacterium]